MKPCRGHLRLGGTGGAPRVGRDTGPLRAIGPEARPPGGRFFPDADAERRAGPLVGRADPPSRGAGNLGSGWYPGGFVAEVVGELPPSDVYGFSPGWPGGVCLLNLVIGCSDSESQEQFDHGLAPRPPFHVAEIGDVG